MYEWDCYRGCLEEHRTDLSEGGELSSYAFPRQFFSSRFSLATFSSQNFYFVMYSAILVLKYGQKRKNSITSIIREQLRLLEGLQTRKYASHFLTAFRLQGAGKRRLQHSSCLPILIVSRPLKTY